MQQIKELKEYIRNNKKLPERSDNLRLCVWMNQQFYKLRNGNQTEEMEKMLNDLRNEEEFNELFKVDIPIRRLLLNRLMLFIDQHNRKPSNKSDDEEEQELCKIWRMFRDGWELHICSNREKVDKMFIEFMNNDKYGIYFKRKTEKWSLRLNKLISYILEKKKLPITGKLEFWYKYQLRKCNKWDPTYNDEIIELWNDFKKSNLFIDARNAMKN